jgi:cytoskeletal protein CcmA (bactofilin family)
MVDETRIPRGSRVMLSEVAGDLILERGAVVTTPGKLSVSGRVSSTGEARVEGDLECSSIYVRDGSMTVTGTLMVHGDIVARDSELFVGGNLGCTRLEVDKRLEVGGEVKCSSLEVAGRLKASSLVCKNVRVGGKMEVSGGVEGERLEVGGVLSVGGRVMLLDLDVGGKAEIGGGRISGSADVGGIFRSNGPLEFGTISVGGIIFIAAGSKGERINVGGKFSANGDIRVQRIDVGGLASIDGNLEGVDVDVGGVFRVGANLTLSGELSVGGKAEVTGEFRGTDVDVGGKLSSTKIILSGTISVQGEISTRQGLKARVVRLGRKARCIGVIVAEEVFAERASTLEEVYAKRVILGDKAEAKRVYGEEVELGEGCRVGEVYYTLNLREGGRVTYGKPPTKLSESPKPPI